MLHLELALELEVEPLDYCARRFGLGDATVMERAAEWAGLAFAPRIPNTLPGSPIIERIERLGEVRSVRARLFEREVVYSAPRFSEFLRLRQHCLEVPEFRRSFCVVPEAAIRAELAAASEEALMEEARHRLFRKWPRASGHVDAPIAARRMFALLLLLVVAVAALGPRLYAPVFLPLVGAILLVPAGLRFWAAVRTRRQPEAPPLLPDSDLPTYTLLVPLRDEASMVPQLCRALKALDYPPEKLDVRFIVEARSSATVAAVRARLADPRFELIEVPDALPRTKPKALNYALPLITGEFLVVYDAEDIPEPGQLRLAASTFAQRPELDCLQAELVIDNAEESWLATLFAGEYAGQFGLMLPLLSHLKLPMPLGGTSNHFRVSALRRIGGWDPYNVTEDADLGIRLARRGLRTSTIASHTSEEAPIRFARLAAAAHALDEGLDADPDRPQPRLALAAARPGLARLPRLPDLCGQHGPVGAAALGLPRLPGVGPDDAGRCTGLRPLGRRGRCHPHRRLYRAGAPYRHRAAPAGTARSRRLAGGAPGLLGAALGRHPARPVGARQASLPLA